MKEENLALAGGGVAAGALLWYLLDDDGGTQTVVRDVGADSESTNAQQQGLIDPQSYIIRTTEDLDAVADNDIGSLARSADPDSTVTIARFDPGYPFALLAVGTWTTFGENTIDGEFQLFVDDERIDDYPTADFGSLEDPFSFPDTLGAGIRCDRSAEIRFWNYDENNSNGAGAVIHAEVI